MFVLLTNVCALKRIVCALKEKAGKGRLSLFGKSYYPYYLFKRQCLEYRMQQLYVIINERPTYKVCNQC